MKRWSEIHGLNKNNETVKVLNTNASYYDFEQTAKKLMQYPAICFVSYKVVNGKKFFAVREILYK